MASEDPKISALRRHARQRNEQSLARIRAAAVNLFTAQGYTGVRMEDLARVAGVTRQTLYRHFPSKYEIALDFMAAARADTLAVWRSLDGGDLADRSAARAWVRKVIAHLSGRPAKRAYVELASSEPAYRSVLADQIAEVIRVLGERNAFFARAAANPAGLDWAAAHLFVATLMERSDFIAIGEEWFAAEHLEAIMADWLVALTARA